METSPPTNILDDLPTEQDALDFGPYVATLVDIISSPSTRTPLTIGVFGTWGSGKTSLMRMVRKGLPKGTRVAWFDAWKYEKEETLWRALLLQVLAALRLAVPNNQSARTKKALAELDDLGNSLYRTIEREEVGRLQIDGSKLAAGIGQGLVQIGLSFVPGMSTLTAMVEELQKEGAKSATEKLVAAFQRERTQIHIVQVQFLDQFQEKFSRLVKEQVMDKRQRLVVFVDDLDRCLPDKAIEVLEAIKLFLDAPGCVFLLGLDQEVIARGVELKYRELGRAAGATEEEQQRFLIEGTRYLEKIIQLPFHLPPIERGDMGDFVKGLVGEWPHQSCPEVFAEGLGDNPRQVKRTINVFLLLWRLSKAREMKLQGVIKPLRLAKVVAIQHIYPELYAVLKETPRLLRELEEYYRAETVSPSEKEVGLEGDRGKVVRIEPPPALVHFVHRAAVRRVLILHPPEMPEANFSGLEPDELRLYFTLTRRAETPQVAPTGLPSALVEPQLVRVPAGVFRMGTAEAEAKQAIADGMDEDWVKWEQPQHSVDLSEYWIGKYPLTNLEYQAFVKEANYRPPAHWNGDQYPEGKGDHPVVNVSWEDTTAYCRWLSEKTGKPYRLPTEAEWEKAARGTDGRIYPWGDEFDSSKCNTREAGIGDTTPVGKYSPAGDSPYGCADMAGNVWEWCADWYADLYVGRDFSRQTESAAKDPGGPMRGDFRALRGGAFNHNRCYARAAARGSLRPDYRVIYNGFRVCVGASPVSPVLDS